MKTILLMFILFFTPFLLQAVELEKVSLQMQWKHQFEYAGFYAAIEQGYYADEGLEVELREVQPGLDPVQEVLDGRADFGITYSSLIAEYLQGRPVVMIANIFKQSALVLISQKEFSLPSDLIGKRVMGSRTELGNSGITMMFHRFNMSVDDVNVIEPTHTIDDFVEKRVDAMTAFITNQPYLLNRKGVKYTIHNPTSYGSQFYDVNVFTSATEFQNSPERVEGFRKATVKGWKYALDNSDEIIDLILQKYNTQHKSREQLQYEAEITKSLILPNVYDVGSIDCQILKEMAENFTRFGVTPKIDDKTFKNFLLKDLCSENQAATFTPQEKQYLTSKQEIKVCTDPDWMPFEKIKDGKHIGMSADYMRIVESVINIPLKVVPTTSWSQSMEYAQARKCDIWSLAMATPDRKKYMDFTRPYLSTPLVIATKTDKFFITDLNEVLGKKLGIVKGYAFYELLKRQYPSLDLVEVESIEKGFEAVDHGKLFGYIDTLAAIGYQMQKNYIGSLKVAGRINQNWDLGIGVRNDEPILVDILNKAISTVDEKTQQAILNEWMSISYEQGFDYALLWKVLGIIGLILLFMLYRYRMLKEHNETLVALNNELEILSITDSLTKIYNRRYLDKRMQEAIHLAKRYKTPFSLILMDIDDFKVINDTYGHTKGDIILQKVVDVLSGQSRKTDIVGRWGGEEFLIICPHSALESGRILAEKMCEAIAKKEFGVDIPVTGSFGVAEYAPNDDSDTLINKVDKALYRAKAEGKNRVVAAE